MKILLCYICSPYPLSDEMFLCLQCPVLPGNTAERRKSVQTSKAPRDFTCCFWRRNKTWETSRTARQTATCWWLCTMRCSLGLVAGVMCSNMYLAKSQRSCVLVSALSPNDKMSSSKLYCSLRFCVFRGKAKI